MADQEQRNGFWENRSLFSDYFLSERLDQKKEWKEDISRSFQKILQIYSEKKEALPTYNEAQTEKEFIQPVLEEVLGFQYDVQHTEKHRGTINTPDYICFSDAETLLKAQQNRGSDAYYADALAIAEAKYWMRSLDEKGVSEKDLLTNVNPSFQIVNYLTVTGLEWGILTNGSKWRLYSSKGRSRIDSYFEVDLKEILEQKDEEQFGYFYIFFRKQAFTRDPQTGISFLESVVKGSVEYGNRLEKKLKDLIFEDIFLDLGRGFVEYRKEEENTSEESAESLQEIYKGTLRLLYRLLFLLHAESRGLLPLDNKSYRQYSLMNLKREIAKRADQDIAQSSRSFDVWNDIDSLFRIIDKGDPALNVPRYNGGLFRRDHPNNHFLADHKISDYYLVPVLEKLTRETDPETGQKRFIDYKSLNVEQLGSVYEGLLEFHLRVAKEKLAVVRENGREVYKPEKNVNNPVKVVQKGELYLENDKGERRATGSYYTPHYIVEYIVEHTLRPVFTERAVIFRDIMDELAPKYEAFNKLDNKIKKGDKGTGRHNQRKGLYTDIKILEKRAVEALLSIKICDPAMGSGHFLKEATDKLAEKIIILVGEYQENPVSRMLEEVRTQIQESLERQNITIDAEEHLRDTNLIKRMVMKRSIYGVDLNPMAVELAKLSLWLDSFTVGAPLSFLDHHLRTGNSLIGTSVEAVEKSLTQDTVTEHGLAGHLFQGGPFAGMLKATGFMHEVAIQTDATFDEVEKSIDKFSEYQKAMAPYKKVLDLWVSQHFDNERAQDLLRSYGQDVLEYVKDNRQPQNETFKKAQSISKEKLFFHWELEFPEVFFDLKNTRWKENQGFDVVLGNPPYSIGRDWEENLNKAFFTKAYSNVQYQLDLYQLFIEKSLKLIKKNGLNSFIVPDTWTVAVYSENLRKFLLEEVQLIELVSCVPEVFPDVTVDTIIYVAKYSYPKSDTKLTVKDFKHSSQDAQKLHSINPTKFLHNEGYKINFWVNNKVFDLIEKVMQKSVALSTICETTRGINAYDKARGQSKKIIESRAYHAKEKLTEEYKPELMGEDVGRYINKWSGNHWIKYGDWLAAPREERFFKNDKLLVRKLLSNGRIVSLVDFERFYVDQQLYIGILREKNGYNLSYLGAICNSILLNFIYLNKYREKDVAFPQLTVNAFNSFSIRKIDFSQFNAEKNTEYPEQLVTLYRDYLNHASTSEELIDLSRQIIEDTEEYRLPLIHDFLAFLAEKMLDYNKEKQRLNSALDPFKFLNKGTVFKQFRTVFKEALKYGDQLSYEIDLGTVHHDIEGLRLEPPNPSDRLERLDGFTAPWQLSLLLKHRDPETDWSDWQKNEDGNIVRSVQPVYQFDLSDEQGRYWQQSFEVLGEFEHNKSGQIFPGGKTRTTHEKLMESDVPIFDEKVNIEPLIELREELAEVEEKIEKTDWLIDQVVYRMYGLSEEEVKVVEGA